MYRVVSVWVFIEYISKPRFLYCKVTMAEIRRSDWLPFSIASKTSDIDQFGQVLVHMAIAVGGHP